MDENKVIIERMRDDISDLKATTQVILTKVDTLTGVLKTHADQEDKDRAQIIEVLQDKADKSDMAQLVAEKNRILAESNDTHKRMFEIMERKADKDDATDIHNDLYDEVEKINGKMWKIMSTAFFAAISALGTIVWEVISHLIAK